MSGLVPLHVECAQFDIDAAIRRAILCKLRSLRWWYRTPDLPKRSTIRQRLDAEIRELLMDIFGIVSEEQGTYIRMKLDGVRFTQVSLASFGALHRGGSEQDYCLFSTITTSPRPRTGLGASEAQRYYLLFTSELTTSGPYTPWQPALPDETDPAKMLVWLTDPGQGTPDGTLPGLVMTMLPNASKVVPALSSMIFRK